MEPFTNPKYDDENENVTDHCYIKNDQAAWHKFVEKNSFDTKTLRQSCVLKCNTLNKEVENIPTLLQSSYYLPKDVLDVIVM